MKRRTLLGTVAVGIPTFNILRVAPSRAQSQTIRLIEAGGLSGASVEAGYIEPLLRRTGIRVERSSPNPLGRLRAMVDADDRGTVLFELPWGIARTAQTLGLLERIDWARVDPDPMFSEARQEYGFGHQYFSTGMAWRSDAKPPQNWVDFFNPKDFPGDRALPDYPQICLPFALLGDGVPADKLFPLDVDRALRKLTEFKSSVEVWWKSGGSPLELLRENDVQYAIAWSGRVIREPAVRFSFRDAMLNMSYFTIVKNSSNEDRLAAWQFLNEASRVENQAKAAATISYTGPSPDIEPLLPPDRIDEYPTTKKNKDMQWLQNPDWWEDNGAEVHSKWDAFMDSL